MKNFLFKLAMAVTGNNVLGAGESTTPNKTNDITSVDQVVAGVSNIFTWVMGPIFTVLGLAAVAYAIYLGVQYARAEDASKRKEVQGRLIGAVIGGVIIVAGATLCYALDWGSIIANFGGWGIKKA